MINNKKEVLKKELQNKFHKNIITYNSHKSQFMPVMFTFEYKFGGNFICQK